MKKTSISSFRVSLVHGVTALAPLAVTLQPMAQAAQVLYLDVKGGPDVSVSGWRLKNNGVILVPDNGREGLAGFTPGIGQSGWAPLPNTLLRLDLYGLELSGPPYDVTLEFYNLHASADYLVGGFLAVREPEYNIHDLVIEMQRDRARLETYYNARTGDNTPKHKTD